MLNENTFDDNHVILNYYQNGPLTLYNHVNMLLVQEALQTEA